MENTVAAATRPTGTSAGLQPCRRRNKVTAAAKCRSAGRSVAHSNWPPRHPEGHLGRMVSRRQIELRQRQNPALAIPFFRAYATCLFRRQESPLEIG